MLAGRDTEHKGASPPRQAGDSCWDFLDFDDERFHESSQAGNKNNCVMIFSSGHV